MAISYVGVGTGLTVAGTSGSVPLPAGILAGDFLLIAVASKYSNVAISGGGTGGFIGIGNFSGGSGASAEDSGTVYLSVAYRIADGTTDASASVNMATVTGQIITANITAYRKTAPGYWMPNISSGVYTHTAGVSWSITTGSGYAEGLQPADFMIGIHAVNSAATFTALTIVQSPLTFTPATQSARVSAGSTGGHNLRLMVCDNIINTGSVTASATPSYTMTGSVSTAESPAGVTAILRLREPVSQRKLVMID